MHTRQDLGHDGQAQALGAGGCIGQAAQHQVHDVVSEVLIPAADEDLAAADAHRRAVGSLTRYQITPGAHQAQVAAGLRLGQAHGAQPVAADQLVEVELAQGRHAVVQHHFIRAMQQAGVHRPAVVGGGQHLEQGHVQHLRQALAAHIGCAGQRRPTTVYESAVGGAVAGWRGHAFGRPGAALCITHGVGGRQHLAGKAPGLGQHLGCRVGVQIGKGRLRGPAGRCAQHPREQMHHVGHRSLVGPHRVLSWNGQLALRAAPR